MPIDVRLTYIRTRSAYMDFKSLEESTGEIKAKYKLLTKQQAGVYIFHVLTKTEATYPTEYRIRIIQSDWDSRENHSTGMHLDRPCSYLGCHHLHIMSEKDILAKRLARDNGFIIAGTLSQTKFREVSDFIKQSRQIISSRANPENEELIDSVFNKGIVSEQIKNKLGL